MTKKKSTTLEEFDEDIKKLPRPTMLNDSFLAGQLERKKAIDELKKKKAKHK